MKANKYGEHYSVLFRECMSELNSVESSSHIFADMTFGAGGHTFGIANLSPANIVYAVDQDPDAIANGQKRILESGVQNKIHLIKMNYEAFPAWVKSNLLEQKFAGILLDIGVSSHQFDEKDRGFSFRQDAKLDMRMAYDMDIPTAADFLNTAEEDEIANIIFNYGEEKFSRKIAAEIIKAREIKQIETTTELENICFHAYPKQMRHARLHPATKTFQALRIHVNRELDVLENTLLELYSLLDVGGKLLVISFHSLEDRIVKHKFKEISQSPENTARIVTKKPILPSNEEVEENGRSRSAKLRIIQKISTEGFLYETGHKKNKYKK